MAHGTFCSPSCLAGYELANGPVSCTMGQLSTATCEPLSTPTKSNGTDNGHTSSGQSGGGGPGDAGPSSVTNNNGTVGTPSPANPNANPPASSSSEGGNALLIGMIVGGIIVALGLVGLILWFLLAKPFATKPLPSAYGVTVTAAKPGFSELVEEGP